MELKVCFINPNQNAASFVQFKNVRDWHTDHGELKVYQSDEDKPTVVFANRQWIWAEEIDDDREPPRHDHHRMGEDEPPARAARTSRPTERRSSRSRQSDLSDLSIPDARSVERAKAASVEFAIDNRTVPWSKAHMEALLKYEDEVRGEYGEEGVLRLPWNQIPRGDDAKRRM